MRKIKGYKKDEYAFIKKGWEVIDGQRIYCRSGYEKDTAYYLAYLRRTGQLSRWAHEPFCLRFPIKNSKKYVPDFAGYRIIDGKEQMVKLIECKGRLQKTDITKIKRLKKYFPDYFDIFCYIGNSSYLNVLLYEYKIKEVIDIKQIKEFVKFFKATDKNDS